MSNKTTATTIAGEQAKKATNKERGWAPISELKKSGYWFGLVADSNENTIRMRLWNPAGRWEHADMIDGEFREVAPGAACSNPTHFMPLLPIGPVSNSEDEPL